MSGDAQQDVPWYAEGVLDDDPATARITGQMRDLAEDWEDATTEFAAFARWVRGEALDPLLFADQIANDPGILAVAWFAWLAARSHGWDDAAPAAPSGAAGGVTVFPTAPPSVAAPPPAAPAGAAPTAPAGVGPHAEVR